MAHEVIITCSPEDSPVAEKTCSFLEDMGIGCWIASRDIPEGRPKKEALSAAIKASKVMVIVFSSYTNRATYLAPELNLATNANVAIIPLRLDDTEPEGVMQYYLADTQWLDADNPPAEEQLKKLADTVKALASRRMRAYPPGSGLKRLKGKLFSMKTNSAGKIAAALVAGGLLLYGGASLIFSISRVVETLRSLI